MPTANSVEENKAIFRRYIEEIYNKCNVEHPEQFLSWDYVFHEASPKSLQGPVREIEIALGMRAAFPDFHITVDQQIAENDLVCSYTTFRGTHLGTIFGIPPSGRMVTMPGLTVTRIRNGKITDAWVKNDVTGLLLQIGADIRAS
jgi:steroid delta-isomerase-like uncharacterized protein